MKGNTKARKKLNYNKEWLECVRVCVTLQTHQNEGLGYRDDVVAPMDLHLMKIIINI